MVYFVFECCLWWFEDGEVKFEDVIFVWFGDECFECCCFGV